MKPIRFVVRAIPKRMEQWVLSCRWQREGSGTGAVLWGHRAARRERAESRAFVSLKINGLKEGADGRC